MQRRPSAGIGDLALEASRDLLGIQTQLLGITADEAESIRGCRQSLEPAATLRLRLIKIAARIVEMKTKIKVHLPTSAPDQSILHLVLGRLPRLVT